MHEMRTVRQAPTSALTSDGHGSPASGEAVNGCLREVLAAGDPSDMARIRTVAKLFAAAALRIADTDLAAAEHGADSIPALTDHHPRPPGDQHDGQGVKP